MLRRLNVMDYRHILDSALLRFLRSPIQYTQIRQKRLLNERWRVCAKMDTLFIVGVSLA